MRSITRRTATIAVALLLLLPRVALAQPTSASPLLNGLDRILRDPGRKVALTPDKGAVVWLSKLGEASFGADGQVRLHRAGTVKRMLDITKGVRGVKVDLGAALGHRERKDPAAVGLLAGLAADPSFSYRLRPDTPGFTGERYSAKSRPLDIWGHSARMTVMPDGSCSIVGRTRGQLGFGRAVAGQPAVGKPVVARPAVARRAAALTVSSPAVFRPSLSTPKSASRRTRVPIAAGRR